MTVTEEERSIFATLDPTGTGQITIQKLTEYLKSDATTAQWADYEADFADQDQDAVITLEEFGRFHRSKDEK